MTPRFRLFVLIIKIKIVNFGTLNFNILALSFQCLDLDSTKHQNICFQVSNAYLQRDLFSLEKQERAMNLKFGVIYAKSGQLTDDEVSLNSF